MTAHDGGFGEAHGTAGNAERVEAKQAYQRFAYQWREECFRQALAAGAEETYVAQRDEKVVGILTIGATRDPDLDVNRTGEIWGIYISPEYWRKGIGSRLVEEAERMLQSRGYENAVG